MRYSGKWVMLCCTLLSLIILRADNASSLTDYDDYFSKGRNLFREGQFDDAREQFERAAAADSSKIDARLNVGVCYLKAGRFDQALNAFQDIVAAFPSDWRPYYFSAELYFKMQEIDKAVKNHRKAQDLGLNSDDDKIGPLLAQYRVRKFDLGYKPLFDINNSSVPLHFKGNPGGDEELLRDTVKQIEKTEYIYQRRMFTDATIEFLRWEPKGSVYVEKWSVSGPDGKKEYWVRYNTAPPPDFGTRTQIEVSERDSFVTGLTEETP